MLTHPTAPVAAGDEPEPQHDRDTSNPDSMPELPRRNAQAVSSQADLMLAMANWADTRKAARPARRTLDQMDPAGSVARATERRLLKRAGVA
ncbi:hypothetical protein [Streptomyces sp. 3N207]|uniref:hypothetical protein n=1 Tax=Streptomyces sp. 3N207 TaxID=3457417 RepID=UPI003FD3A28F